jgi:hypothetical protein
MPSLEVAIHQGEMSQFPPDTKGLDVWLDKLRQIA